MHDPSKQGTSRPGAPGREAQRGERECSWASRELSSPASTLRHT